MKIFSSFLVLSFSLSGFASSLVIIKDGTSGSVTIGAEIRYFKLLKSNTIIDWWQIALKSVLGCDHKL